MWKKVLLVSCFLVLIAVAFRTSPSLDTASPVDALRIGISSFPNSLNPVYSSTESAMAITNKIFDSPFIYDCDGNLQNGLVDSFAIAENKRFIRLTLKRDIYFSNGKELCAADVIDTLMVIKNRRFDALYLSVLDFIKGCEMLSRYSLRLSLRFLPADWKGRLTIKIFNAHELKNITPYEFKNRILSGTGPYQVDKVFNPSKVFLKLNKYNTDRSMYRYLHYELVANPGILPLKLMAKEIDICELQPCTCDAYPSVNAWKEKFSLLEYKKFGYTYLVFNLKNPALDKNIRRIFYNHLVHGDFIRRFLKGRGEPVSSPFLLLSNRVKNRLLSTCRLDRELHVKILVNAESRLRKQLVIFLAKEMKEYNIFIEPEFLEYLTFLEYMKRPDFDIAISGFVLDIDYCMKDILHSSAYFNYAGFKSADMDGLLDRGLAELDVKKREDIYWQAHDLWLEELPMIPLFSLRYYYGVSRDIKIPANVSRLVGAEGDFLYNIRQWKAR